MSQTTQFCREHLDRFFESYPDPTMQKRSLKALRFLSSRGNPLAGKPEGWAAGIIYGLATRHRRACGVPGILNAEFERFFGVSMSTVRKRAAQVMRELSI